MKQKSEDLFDKLSAHGISWTDPICHKAHHRVVTLGEDEDTVVKEAVGAFKRDLKAWIDLSLTPYSQKHNLSLKQAISVAFEDLPYNQKNPMSDLIQMRDLYWNGRGENFASALLSGKTEHDIEANDTIALLKQAVKYEAQEAEQASADLNAMKEVFDEINLKLNQEIKELSQWKEAVMEKLSETFPTAEAVKMQPKEALDALLSAERLNYSLGLALSEKEEEIQNPDFTLYGVEYTTVLGDDFSCFGCAFQSDVSLCADDARPKCIGKGRGDKQEVIFIEKNK